MISEVWVEGVLKIANSKPLIDKYQGNVAFPQKILKCQVYQVLEANAELTTEWKEHKKEKKIGNRNIE